MTTVRRGTALVVAALAACPLPSHAAPVQGCPAPLDAAKRLVLVTADSMADTAASMRLYQRPSVQDEWRALGPRQPAMIGKTGMAWSPFFGRLARDGEPIKVEGDKRAPAGIYRIGRSFGILPSSRANYLHVTPDTICVDDVSSPAYNTIASRRRLGPNVSAEYMSKAVPMYRRGLFVDYPTDAAKRAGSCIFIHVWRSPRTGTAGCVAVPEPRVEALQDFSALGAVLAIMPRGALARLEGCLPKD